MSVNIDVESRGIDKSIKLLDGVINEMDSINHELLIKAGEKIVYEARNNLQNNTNINSGDLLSSIKILFDDGESIYVGSDMPYAGHIEFGRGPVFPLDPDGVLHWIDKDGKDVFAKKAGPTEPQPFLAPAVERVTQETPTLIATEYEKKMRGMANG